MNSTEVLDAGATMSPRWQTYGCAGTWQRGTINIRQRIGELTVGQMSFAGAILANDFLTAPLLGLEIDDLPVNEFPRGCDAIKVASAPVETAPAPLRLATIVLSRASPKTLSRPAPGMNEAVTA